MALISEVAQICSFICSEMSLCQSLSYILPVLNSGFFSHTPTLCCQIQNGLTAKRIEIQTPATSQMKDILTLFLNINKLPPLEKRNIRMNTRETNSTFFFATVRQTSKGNTLMKVTPGWTALKLFASKVGGG